MQLDVAASYASPKASLAGPSASARLRLSMQAGPICLVPRLLDGTVAAALESMAPAALPTLDVSGTLDRVRLEVEASFDARDNMSNTTMAWLRRDMLDLAGLFAAAAGVERLRLHLQVVEDDMCRRFHVDNVAFRLITTYRGPGTEWMPPRDIAQAPEGTPLPTTATRRLERGTIAIMRGGRNATVDRPGILHRSPPIEGSGVVRLLLAINDVDGVVQVGQA